MPLPGRVKNGVVQLEGGARLPEGTPVTVSWGARVRRKPGRKKRVKFPLVDSKHPGALHLTAERIAEILEQEDVFSFRKSLRQRQS
jgi:hypothetical protein